MFDLKSEKKVKRKNKVHNICTVLLLAAMLLIQGCGTTATEATVIESTVTEATATEATVTESTVTESTVTEPTAAEPTVIVDMTSYEYKWEPFEGHKMADTTGSATLILDKNGNLYYFGAESPEPVIIMKDVKAFSLDDDSDTLGYTAPVAAILTNSGDMYVCGDASWGAAEAVNTLATPPDNGEIPFTEPLLVNSNVTDIHVGFRQMACTTADNKFYLSPSPYDLYERPKNPTDI